MDSSGRGRRKRGDFKKAGTEKRRRKITQRRPDRIGAGAVRKGTQRRKEVQQGMHPDEAEAGVGAESTVKGKQEQAPALHRELEAGGFEEADVFRDAEGEAGARVARSEAGDAGKIPPETT